MVTVCWHCLDMTENDERFVAGALKELAQNLEKDPIKLPVSIKQLRDKSKLTEKVRERLNKLNDQSCEFSACSAGIADIFASEEGIVQRLLIYCRPDSSLANTARKGPAEWGATCGSFSATYPPRDLLKSKFTIWHEAVHLLLRRPDNSDECYEPYSPYPPKADCNCDTCIMRHKPNEKWDGKLSMCDKIIGFLKELSKNC